MKFKKGKETQSPAGGTIKASSSAPNLYDMEAAEEVKIDSDDETDLSRQAAAGAAYQKRKTAEVFYTDSLEAGSADAGLSYKLEQERLARSGCFWRLLLGLFITFPWIVVLCVAYVVNLWQRLFRPLAGAAHYMIDYLDRRVPSVVEIFNTLYGILSLALHFVTVILNLYIIKGMYDNGQTSTAAAMIFLYLYCHLCQAVIMFKELDHKEMQGGTFKDIALFVMRLFDVLFYDTQLFASVIHSNKMIEGMTQLMLKGYEESRVALTAVMFTLPCCIVSAVAYNGIPLQFDVNQLRQWRNYESQTYAALVLAVLNSLEKLLRLSMMDPAMHKLGDGFPLLYVRSDAAGVPGSLVRDWLFRCKTQLRDCEGKLSLRELYGHYTLSVKDEVHHLCDKHKATLLRKAVHVFNTQHKYRPEAADELVQRTMIRALAADGIEPGEAVTMMIAEMLCDTIGFNSLSLSNNQLDDGSLMGIMEALKYNEDLRLQYLDLSGNQIYEPGAAALAEYLAPNKSTFYLSLKGNPIKDEGAIALAEALKTNIGLYQLDLANCHIGPEGGVALGNALKVNNVLTKLDLSGTGIGNAGCDAVAKALKSNHGVRELNLSHTSIDDKVAASLSAMLIANKTLEKLYLSSINMTNAGAQAICNALQQNTGLQVIDVSENAFMDKSWQKLMSHMLKLKTDGRSTKSK